MAQWLTNLTRNNEVVGLIPGLAQWVRDPTCRELWYRLQCGLDPTLLWLWHRLAATAPIRPIAWEPPGPRNVKKTDRETDRQKDRKTDRQKDRKKDRKTDRQKDRKKRQTERKKETNKLIEKETRELLLWHKRISSISEALRHRSDPSPSQ